MNTRSFRPGRSVTQDPRSSRPEEFLAYHGIRLSGWRHGPAVAAILTRAPVETHHGDDRGRWDDGSRWLG